MRQLLQVQKAYGTAIQQNYATYEYTSNDTQKAVIDANANRAELRYDGQDRQVRWVPSKASLGYVNEADYEQYAYDAAGNRTSMRKRDGTPIFYTYDNLNRWAWEAGNRAEAMRAFARAAHAQQDSHSPRHNRNGLMDTSQMTPSIIPTRPARRATRARDLAIQRLSVV